MLRIKAVVRPSYFLLLFASTYASPVSQNPLPLLSVTAALPTFGVAFLVAFFWRSAVFLVDLAPKPRSAAVSS